MNCAHIAQNAGGLVALGPQDAERVAAYTHAASCVTCTEVLRQAVQSLALLITYAQPFVPDAAALARIRKELARQMNHVAPSRAWSIVPVVLALAAGVMPLISQISLGITPRLAFAMAMAFAAAVVLGVSLVGPAALFVLIPGMSAVLAAASGTTGPLDAPGGLHCLGFELALATPVLASAVWLVRQGALTRPRLSLAAAGAAGALAGQAALLVKCGSQASHSHNLVFHAGAVLLAAGVGYALSTTRLATVRTTS